MKRLLQKTAGRANRRNWFGRGAAPRPRRNARLLSSELLESRQLLAGDFQNAAFPPDVNDDGWANVADLLGVVVALRDGGPRSLVIAAPGEGEDHAAATPGMFVDVNGDDYLSLSDALNVVFALRGEGEAMSADDNFTVAANSNANDLDVTANDLPNGGVVITRVGTAQNGLQGTTAQTQFFGTVTVDTATNTVKYTPRTDFYGTDRFIYEIRDPSDNTFSIANVDVLVNPTNETLVRFTYKAVDPADQGNPNAPAITSVERGETFVLQVFVQDTRRADPDPDQPGDDRGVAAAALDVTYQSNLATVLDVEFSPDYNLLDTADISTNGVINEASAAQSDLANQPPDPPPAPLGPNPVLFFEATIQATAEGTLNIQGDPADVPENQTVFLEPGQLEAVPRNPPTIDYGTLQLTVSPPQGAVADTFVRNEDLTPGATPDLSSAVLDVLANDTVIGGNTPFVGNIIDLDPNQPGNQTQLTLAHGAGVAPSTVTITPGGGPGGRDVLTYAPGLNFFGAEPIFSYVVQQGGAGGPTDAATVSITVNEINDAPTAVADAYNANTNSTLTITAPGVLSNDTDPDNQDGLPGNDDVLVVSQVNGNAANVGVATATAHGSVTVAANGSFTYTPATDFVGTDSFTYQVSDGQGGVSSTTVTLTVAQPVNPLAAVLVSVTDLNGNDLGAMPQVNVGQEFIVRVQVQDLRDPAAAQLGLGLFSAFIDLQYSGTFVDFVGPVTFGSAYNNTSFRNPGDASVDGLINEVGSVQTDIFAGPIGAGPFTLFTVRLQADQFGKATITADPADLAGNDIQLFDPPTILAANQVTFGSIMVNIVNPTAGTPVANNDAYVIPGGAPFQVTSRAQGVLGNDVDPEGDNTIQAVLTAQPTSGQVTLNSNGTFTYTPSAGFIGTDTFRYRATDGGPLSNEATVTLTVAASVNNDQFNGNVNQVVTGNVLANDAVPAGSQVALVTAPTQAANFVLNPNGTFTYTPTANQSYTDTFVYQVAGLQATVIIRIGSPAAQVSGFAYTDEDSSQHMELDERRLGGITITLRNNTTGQTFTTETAANGAYSFNNVPAGAYTLTGGQPEFMIDGWDSVNGQITASDSVQINVNGVPQRVDFGERGLRAEFVSPRDFFGQADPNGFQIATNAGNAIGDEFWFSFLDGYSNFTKAEASVSADGSRATIRLTRNDGQTFTLNNVSLTADPHIRLMGRMGDGVVLRFEGTAAQFLAGAVQAAADAEGEYQGSVDQIFADGWDE